MDTDATKETTEACEPESEVKVTEQESVQQGNVNTEVAENSEEKDKKAEQEEKVEQEQEVFEPFEKWEDLELSEDLLRGIYNHGFDSPSKIQTKGIKPIMSGKDVIAQAQSGTGKTGTFCISTLAMVDFNSDHIQALILAPTRELATQTHTVIRSLGNRLENLRVSLMIGGVSKQVNFQSLQSKPQIIIGTPGRVSDLISSSKLLVGHIKLFVLDEADEMLSRGFSEQVHKIFMYLSPDIQVVLMSATMPTDVLEVTSKFMRDPVKILVKNDDLTLEGIRQFYIDVRTESNKLPTLVDLWATLKISQAVIFCNTKRRVETLTQNLSLKDIVATSMHGGMEQNEREKIMEDFREQKARVLITTDLLSRGIDVQQVSLVINFDVPRKMQTYIHRIGRGGRFGRKGVAINLIKTEDADTIAEIQKHYSCHIEQMPSDIQKYI